MKRFVKRLNNAGYITRLTFFGVNSGVHGLRHIFGVKIYVVTRMFWLLMLIVSMGCLYVLLVPVAARGDEINFTPDTRYLGWTTTFPAVTVCELYNARAAQKKFAERYPGFIKPLSFDYKKHLTAILYGRGTCGQSYCVPCGPIVPCNLHWRDIINNIRLNCNELISNCIYNGVEFPCCNKIHIVDSEYGPCFSINTLQNKNITRDKLFSVNSTTGPGILTFRLLSDAQISVHSPEELSTNNLDVKFKFDVHLYLENRVRYLFSVVEMENDPMLAFEEISVRRCRYLQTEIPEEPLYIYPVYSYGACRLVQETEQSFKACGCIHPVRDISYQKNFCNYTGLKCYITYEVDKLKWGKNKNVTNEECLPSCEESELTFVHISRSWVKEERGKGALVNIEMASLPTLRFKRNLVRTNLDLVVSIGGLVGLFFGASILSIVEIAYLILRPSK